MKLKSLKIHIQHSPMKGDVDEWIMDIQADGDVRKEVSYKASTIDVLLQNLNGAIEVIKDERIKTMWSEVLQPTGEPAAGV